MSLVKRFFRPSLIGTFSNKVYDETGPLTASRKVKLPNGKELDQFNYELEKGFGKISRNLFLYTIVTYGTRPNSLYKKYHKIRKLMKVILFVEAIFLFCTINATVDLAIGLNDATKAGLYGLGLVVVILNYIKLSHKAKQIAVGVVFPSSMMFIPKNHLKFEEGLYDFRGREIFKKLIINDALYNEIEKAITGVKS